MLEVFKDLKVVGNSAALNAFIDQVTANLDEGWERDTAREDELNRMMGSNGYHGYAFRWKGPHPPAATLYLTRKSNRFEVSSIRPKDVGSLSHADYHSILDNFAEFNVQPAATLLGLSVTITADRRDITHWMSRKLRISCDRSCLMLVRVSALHTRWTRPVGPTS
jgi:hypothetical protein